MTCTWSFATAVNSPGRPNVTISRLHELIISKGSGMIARTLDPVTSP